MVSAASFMTKDQMRVIIRQSWIAMYAKLLEFHLSLKLPLTTPITDRAECTRSGVQSTPYEKALQAFLAFAIGCPVEAVGKRTIKLKRRKKSFDVCWPLSGPPKILISVKTMHSSRKNLNNRFEEADGDAAALRKAYPDAVFGYFFVYQDSIVSRGEVQPVEYPRYNQPDKTCLRYPVLVHEGGDCFEYNVPQPTRLPKPLPPDELIHRALQTELIDLQADEGDAYDAVAFLPYQVLNLGSAMQPNWQFKISEVAKQLRFETFIPRIMELAQQRGFLPAGAPLWSTTSVPFCLTSTDPSILGKTSPASSSYLQASVHAGRRGCINAPWVYC